MFFLGHVKWDDESKNVALISWRTLPEWANYVTEWVRTRGLSNQVMTIFELLNKEVSTHSEFVGTDEEMFIQILTIMESKGKCTLIKNSKGAVTAVKFA